MLRVCRNHYLVQTWKLLWPLKIVDKFLSLNSLKQWLMTQICQKNFTKRSMLFIDEKYEHGKCFVFSHGLQLWLCFLNLCHCLNYVSIGIICLLYDSILKCLPFRYIYDFRIWFCVPKFPD